MYMFLVKVLLCLMWYDFLVYVLILLNFVRVWIEFVFDQRFFVSFLFEIVLLFKVDIEIFFWYNSIYLKLILLYCSYFDVMDN